MEVYPNPTDGMLHINIPAEVTGQLTVSIYNLIGELVYFASSSDLVTTSTSKTKTTYTLDLYHLSNGSYLLRVQTEDRFFMEQVIFSR